MYLVVWTIQLGISLKLQSLLYHHNICPIALTLRDLVDSYNFVCSIPALSFLTHYLDIQGHANTVINLIFLDMSCAQVFYHIESDLKWFLNHVSFIVDLSITSGNICMCRIVLKHNSEEKAALLFSVSKRLSQLDFYTLNFIASLNSLSEVIYELFSDF